MKDFILYLKVGISMKFFQNSIEIIILRKYDNIQYEI